MAKLVRALTKLGHIECLQFAGYKPCLKKEQDNRNSYMKGQKSCNVTNPQKLGKNFVTKILTQWLFLIFIENELDMICSPTLLFVHRISSVRALSKIDLLSLGIRFDRTDGKHIHILMNTCHLNDLFALFRDKLCYQLYLQNQLEIYIMQVEI